MKYKYIDKRFGCDALRMISTINGILEEYVAAGYDLSLRQCYYQLVARGIVENTERSYKNVGNLVSDARLAGYIDWDVIKDRGREMVQNSHWESPKDILNACAGSFRVDRWENQPRYVEVMVEKQALEGVLIPVCQEWDVPFTANKGYSSSSALYEAGQRMFGKLQEGKDVFVIYLGDHDPSGIDMSRDVLDRLRLFAECHEDDFTTVDVNRAALNIEQVRKLNPPPNPAKLTDSRAGSYIQKFGRISWELDAIEPKALATLVSKAIQQYVDFDKWEESGARQQTGRNALHKMAEKYKEPRK
jgi:hypothetical protein